MDTIEIQTLIDITNTNVVRPNQGTQLEMNQYRNFTTLRQCAEIRSVILYDNNPHVILEDVKGLDLMKSNFPPLFKKFGEHIINEIMFGKSKNDIDKQILAFRNEIRTIGWKHILKPTGLKKMSEYLAGPPSAGEIFSKIKLKCPINTKAAIYTNDVLRFKKLDKKYPTFQIGDKIYLVYLKDNPYRIDAIALNGYNDAPELLEFAEKYIDRDGLFDSVMKNKLESLYSDLGWGAVVLNPNINKFFIF
jgi:hypothetical protein